MRQHVHKITTWTDTPGSIEEDPQPMIQGDDFTNFSAQLMGSADGRWCCFGGPTALEQTLIATASHGQELAGS